MCLLTLYRENKIKMHENSKFSIDVNLYFILQVDPVVDRVDPEDQEVDLVDLGE